MNISLPAFAPENLVSRDGFGSPVSRQPADLHTQAICDNHAYSIYNTGTPRSSLNSAIFARSNRYRMISFILVSETSREKKINHLSTTCKSIELASRPTFVGESRGEMGRSLVTTGRDGNVAVYY